MVLHLLMLTKYFLLVKNGDNCDANLVHALSNRLINLEKLQEQWLDILVY
jgi:hypothetical protein